MQTNEYEAVKDMLQQILDRDGPSGLLESATLTILQYSQICGHGIVRGKRLFVVDRISQDEAHECH